MPTPTGAALPRTIPQAAIDLVRHAEGLYLDSYRCPAGVPTIGYDHTNQVRMAAPK